MLLRLSNSQAASSGFGEGAGCPFVYLRSPKKEGSRAPTGAGADTPHPVARLAVEPISGKSGPEMTGHTGPARLSALCCGVFLTASGRAFADGASMPTAVSQLLAGGHSTSGRS